MAICSDDDIVMLYKKLVMNDREIVLIIQVASDDWYICIVMLFHVATEEMIGRYE